MITTLLKEFCNEFGSARQGKFLYNNSTRILTSKIPFEIIHDFALRESQYIVKGSVGQGGWAEIPWVAILNRGVTNSTQNGYYIAILISNDLKQVYVTLGLGWTQFHERYGTKVGMSKIASFGYMLSKKLPLEDEDYTEIIDLGAKAERGRGYEAGNICSRKFDIERLENDEIYDALEIYLEYYFILMKEVGADVFFDDYETSDLLAKDERIIAIEQRIRQLSSSYKKAEALMEIKTIADTLPPKKREYIAKRTIRNRAFADFVKIRANFVCELCGKEPFIKRDGTPYAEADHVEPLYNFGVDHPDNMRCLCAQCHRIITYGSQQEITKLGHL